MRREGRLERVGPTNSKGEAGPTFGRPTQRTLGASGRLECAGPTGRGAYHLGRGARHALKGNAWMQLAGSPASGVWYACK
jgi:hypothetical protein